MQSQILDQHGLHQIIGRTVPLGGRLVDQSLGLWVLLPLGLAQAIEKDRSQVFFLGGVVKGLSTREAGVPERKLDGRSPTELRRAVGAQEAGVSARPCWSQYHCGRRECGQPAA